MAKPPFRKRQRVMTAAAYQVIADIIRRIEDVEFKQRVADYIGTEFNRRSTTFDPGYWNRVTGGHVAPNSAANK